MTLSDSLCCLQNTAFPTRGMLSPSLTAASSEPLALLFPPQPRPAPPSKPEGNRKGHGAARGFKSKVDEVERKLEEAGRGGADGVC